ncbi:MAG: hypothetical protein JKY44_01090 [Flavobacteriaceae bacterium]|nr:hypothetical protein [Flavobacteriaceae bacterium]
MKKPLLLLSIILFLSCTESKNEKKIVYEETTEPTENAGIGSTLKSNPESKLIAGLPFKLDSAKTKIFPIGEIRLPNKKRGITKVSSYSGSNFNFFAIGSYSNREYYGYLDNLIFENIETGERHLLTNEKIKIKTFGQLHKEQRIPLKKLIFEIITKDSNRDNKLNDSDLTNLYISGINGENLTLISKLNEDLIDWTLLNENLLYFRTIEDSNKNGEIEESDTLHMYKTDLNNLKTVEILKSDLNKLN